MEHLSIWELLGKTLFMECKNMQKTFSLSLSVTMCFVHMAASASLYSGGSTFPKGLGGSRFCQSSGNTEN